MKTGADIICHTCPFPQFTNDSKVCRDCPKGQVPTDKGDGCRCAEGRYNATPGVIKCFDVGFSYNADLASALATTAIVGATAAAAAPGAAAAAVAGDSDTTASATVAASEMEVCPICPKGSCVSCIGGVARVRPGFALSGTQANMRLPIDTIHGNRPVFACTQGAGLDPRAICLGDEGGMMEKPPNTTMQKNGVITTVHWENRMLCGQVQLYGTGESQEPCENLRTSKSLAKQCIYTMPTQGNASQGTKSVREACEMTPPVINRWCGTGYTGPLCSNCQEMYARGGIVREVPCTLCGDPWPWYAWALITAVAGVGLVILENAIMNFEKSNDDEDEEERALLGVALVIGNGQYDHWPSLDAAHTDGAQIAHELQNLGYRTIVVENADKESLEQGLRNFSAALTTEMAPGGPLSKVPQRRPGMKEDEVAAVVFYSGHGCQIDAVNYMVPVDAPLNAHLEDCVDMKELFTCTRSTKGPAVVMIDAGEPGVSSL